VFHPERQIPSSSIKKNSLSFHCAELINKKNSLSFHYVELFIKKNSISFHYAELFNKKIVLASTSFLFLTRFGRQGINTHAPAHADHQRRTHTFICANENKMEPYVLSPQEIMKAP